MNKNLKKEFARDVIALGGIPFYFIVIIRAIIGDYLPFIYQLVIALVILFILSKLIKNSDQHIARFLIMVVFTSIFYKSFLYTIFAFALWLIMIICSVYSTKPKLRYKELFKGTVLGVISIGAAYYLTFLLFG